MVFNCSYACRVIMTTPEEETPGGGLKVRLHPFLHQVSGSTLMFKFDKDTICKPLLQKEYNFYKFLPESLKEFTARYKGSIEIKCEEAADGTVLFFGIVPPSKVSALTLATGVEISELESKCKEAEFFTQQYCVDFIQDDELRLKRSGSIEMDEGKLECYDNPMTKLEASTRLNKRLATLLDSTSSADHRFILLENLVSNFKHPSVLDLKMGTRTHGDDDNERKKQNKRTKCENSTSKSLGVRLHGMQKYNKENGKFETLSKAFGLKMTCDQFNTTMTTFLHDGRRLRSELVQPIYNRLKHFYHCVSQQDTFRFYSSSLLIMYDGGGPTNKVDVRAIDFAHTTHQSSPHAQNGYHVGPDKGYLLGIQTLIDTFEKMIPN